MNGMTNRGSWWVDSFLGYGLGRGCWRRRCLGVGGRISRRLIASKLVMTAPPQPLIIRRRAQLRGRRTVEAVFLHAVTWPHQVARQVAASPLVRGAMSWSRSWQRAADSCNQQRVPSCWGRTAKPGGIRTPGAARSPRSTGRSAAAPWTERRPTSDTRRSNVEPER